MSKTMNNKKTLAEEEYNMPSIDVNGHTWIRLVDHRALTERLTTAEADIRKDEREKVLQEVEERKLKPNNLDAYVEEVVDKLFSEYDETGRQKIMYQGIGNCTPESVRAALTSTIKRTEARYSKLLSITLKHTIEHPECFLNQEAADLLDTATLKQK